MRGDIAILWLLTAYLVVADPLLGVRMYRQLQAGRLTRMACYRTTVLWAWSLTALAVAVFLAGGIPLRLLGLYNPHGIVWPAGMLGGVLAGMAAGIVTVCAVATLPALRRRLPAGAAARQGPRAEPPHAPRCGPSEPQGPRAEPPHPPPIAAGAVSPGPPARRPFRSGPLDALLPRTGAERLAFVGVALTAGICEEVLFRGVPVFVLGRQFPDIGPLATTLAAAVLFGAAHLHQGWGRVAGTGLMGAILTGVYLSTGALWIPMVVHVLVELRALLVRAPLAPGAP